MVSSKPKCQRTIEEMACISVLELGQLNKRAEENAVELLVHGLLIASFVRVSNNEKLKTRCILFLRYITFNFEPSLKERN